MSLQKDFVEQVENFLRILSQLIAHKFVDLMFLLATVCWEPRRFENGFSMFLFGRRLCERLSFGFLVLFLFLVALLALIRLQKLVDVLEEQIEDNVLLFGNLFEFQTLIDCWFNSLERFEDWGPVWRVEVLIMFDSQQK